MSDIRTVRVTGKGQIKVRPDVTRITITLEGSHKDYGDALRNSAQDTETIKDLLSAFGFVKSDLKTLAFNVDTEYESYQESGVYKQRFIGYRFRHTMKLEFTSDNDRLGRILYALANSPLKPEFRISYTVSEPESAKNELLHQAVRDAKEKAAVLTSAAGVVLKDIISIDYSWGELDLEVRPMNRALADGAMLYKASAVDAGSYELDIEPDDINVSDTVTVVWEIE